MKICTDCHTLYTDEYAQTLYNCERCKNMTFEDIKLKAALELPDAKLSANSPDIVKEIHSTYSLAITIFETKEKYHEWLFAPLEELSKKSLLESTEQDLEKGITVINHLLSTLLIEKQGGIEVDIKQNKKKKTEEAVDD